MAFRENYNLGTASKDLEDKENDKIDFAVHLLSHLKQRPLSVKSARKLEAMKYKFLSPLGMYSQSSFKRKALQIHEPKTPKAPPTKETFYDVAPQGRKVHVAPQVLQEERAGNLFYGNYAPPDIPPVPSLRHLIIECSKPFEKQLTCSDVDDGQSRLAMSKEDVENHIFPLLEKGDDPVQGIKVLTYDMDGKSYSMEFKIWVSKIHVLTGGWKGFCNEKGLVEKQDFVTIWAFRTEESLCFAIGSRRLPVFHAIKKKKLRHN